MHIKWNQGIWKEESKQVEAGADVVGHHIDNFNAGFEFDTGPLDRI